MLSRFAQRASRGSSSSSSSSTAAARRGVAYKAPLRDIQFLLHEVNDNERLARALRVAAKVGRPAGHARNGAADH
jgi:hypothetical protein